ncbi:MAG: hypothetical protein K2V38_03790, partial [Gemmataceae bacterium]|nr:hypothetical protein [Gemmataceae bacterium]
DLMTPAAEDPQTAIVRLVVRLRAAHPAARDELVRQLLPLLASGRVPIAVRYGAAARALEALPDTSQAIRGVVKALTGRIPLSRGLVRLRHLQNLTEKSDALDTLIERRERKVKMSCPRCAVTLPRAGMAKHLWHEHGLMLVRGKTRSPARLAESLRRAFATSGDPAILDQAQHLAGERALGAIAAGVSNREEAAPLLADARARGVGLCPGCFAGVEPRVRELPPPLALAEGRVAGDGFVATAPALAAPRVRATLVAGLVLLAFALVVPVVAAFALSGVAYALGRVLFRPRHTPDDLALDAAWRKLAPRLIDRRDAGRFLVRLCITSAGRGDPFERANALNALVARARANPKELQLLAVALALKVDDGGRFGRDVAAGFAELIGPAFRGDRPAAFAEHALGLYFRAERDPGELARLRVLLLAEAFAAELAPRELLDLCEVAPNAARAIRLSPNHVALLYGLWASRASKNWKSVGPARTVFDLAASAPTTAARLLAREPGLALACDTDREVAGEFGPVLVSLSGVSLGGRLVADPATEVRLTDRSRRLVWGPHELWLGRGFPAELPDELRAWLVFRAEVLAGYPAQFLRADAPTVRLLKGFARRCPGCGVRCVPVAGAVSRALG